MIDAHIHVAPPRLPGVGPLSPLLTAAPEAVAERLRAEMQAAGVSHALAMGQHHGSDDDPLGVAQTLRVAANVPGLYAIGVADPTRTDAAHLKRAEAALTTGRVRALKCYLGYLHFGPDHANYRPYYEMAARHRVPVVFHTGDTYSPYAKLKYAHPLRVDEVAVDHPDVKFVIAHCGNPWLVDAAAVIYKNMNVWADLSGLVVGTADAFTAPQRRDILSDLRANVQRAFRYAERPNRFIHGSDWPLAPLADYASFAASLVPGEFHDCFFDETARGLFRLT